MICPIFVLILSNSRLVESMGSRDNSTSSLTLKSNTLLEQILKSLRLIAKATGEKPPRRKAWNATMKKEMMKSQNESRGEFKLRYQEEIVPEEAFGLMTLPKTYSRKDPPSKTESTEVYVVLQPKAITSINSMKKTMGMEIKMSLMWEDQRIEWNGLNVNELDCWSSVSPSTTILR